MSQVERSLLKEYLNKNGNEINTSAVAFCASIDQVASVSPDIAKSVVRELRDQRSNLKLIASENYCSPAVQLAQGNLMTDKYAEGYPYHRFYAGCDNVDAIEAEACELACKLFGAEHAYVQPALRLILAATCPNILQRAGWKRCSTCRGRRIWAIAS